MSDVANIPLRIMGWVLGGLSLLSLIEDLSPLELYGKLKLWLSAYTQFIGLISEGLFGWLEFRWISITFPESHVLVITSLFAAAFARAQGATVSKANAEHSWGQGAVEGGMFFAVFFSWSLIPALIFPGWGGVVGATIGALIVAISVLFGTDELGQRSLGVYARSADVRRELVGVIGVFALLIALNFLYFDGSQGHRSDKGADRIVRGSWFAVVGSFASEANAIRAAEQIRLDARNYEVHIFLIDDLFRVTLGQATTKQRATDAAQDARASGIEAGAFPKRAEKWKQLF
jgi:hypothetical protein